MGDELTTCLQTYSESSSLADLHVQFGTGSLSGPMGVDDLHVGPFTVFNQSFGLIQKAEGSVSRTRLLEGILGPAFPAMAARGSSPFFDTIIEQKALKSNKFAFYFSLSTPSPTPSSEGTWIRTFTRVRSSTTR